MESQIDIGAPQRDVSNDEIVLGVLDAIERDPAMTQRSVARELGIALGLANAYLKRCARKGLIKFGQAPARRYAYYLTPQGFAEKSRLTAQYLTHSFSFFRRARKECSELFAAAAAHGHRRLALIGKGDLAQLASLVARDYVVEIVGVAEAESDAMAAQLAELGTVDAVMITALVDSGQVFAAAVSAFGAERVYAPSLLRLRVTAADAVREVG